MTDFYEERDPYIKQMIEKIKEHDEYHDILSDVNLLNNRSELIRISQLRNDNFREICSMYFPLLQKLKFFENKSLAFKYCISRCFPIEYIEGLLSENAIQTFVNSYKCQD